MQLPCEEMYVALALDQRHACRTCLGFHNEHVASGLQFDVCSHGFRVGDAATPYNIFRLCIYGCIHQMTLMRKPCQSYQESYQEGSLAADVTGKACRQQDSQGAGDNLASTAVMLSIASCI